jgi:hypothetical protein
VSSTLVVAKDYKYSDGVWSNQVAETFQLVNEKRTSYIVSAGYITQQVQSEYSFYDRAAPASTTPETPPPYYFPDATFRYDPAYTLQLTAQGTTDYAASGSSSVQVTTADFNPATGQFDTTTTTVAGNAPRAITVNSAFTSLVQQPTAGTLIDGCIDEHFVSGKASLDLPWAETAEEVNRATRRQMQRDSAMVRRVALAANPLMKIGDTVRLVDQKRTVAASHMLTGKKITRNTETGAANMQLTLEFWVR